MTDLLRAWRQDLEAEPVIAAAAAMLAIVFAGLGIAARDAQPGDTLWGISRVLYTDHARSAEAAKAALPAVSDEDGRAQLETRYTLLAAKLGISAPVPKPEGGR